ncbi:MAG TPA: DUF4157 domain-containing protein [Kofleriaceae bacterium]|nr:DUF4157 domain-containing protein [Kofleriaceae bacterium]
MSRSEGSTAKESPHSHHTTHARPFIGNQELQRAARAEQRASDVGARSTQPPAGGALTAARGDGSHVLTRDGRAYFEPLVGAQLGEASIHVDGNAARLTAHAHANAAAFGRRVFVAPSRFAPETAAGRRLLAHELTHVGHDATTSSTLFRDAADPHYPSRDEQHEIEKLLGRDTVVAPPPQSGTAATAPALVVDRRTKLEDSQIEPAAQKLVAPIGRWLDRHPDLDAEPNVTLADANAAMVATRKASSAVFAMFGPYVSTTPPSLTTDTKATPKQLADANQVRVGYGWDLDEPQTFARNVAQTQCKETSVELLRLTDSSREAVLDHLVALLMRDDALWQKMVRAAKNSVGGKEVAGSHAILLTPYSREAYPDAVHELLHELTHPAFDAVFERGVKEGFTEYFTEEVAGARKSGYDDQVQNVKNIRDAMQGPLAGWQGDSPEESLRRAYFQGRLDLLGWRPTEDEKAQPDAAAAPAWDATTAARELQSRNQRARAAQSAHDTLLGVGLYYSSSSSPLAALRYARVIARSAPVAEAQLYLEGQLLGTVTGDPHRLGASAGIGVEQQEPGHYLGAGVRVQATGATGGAFDFRADLAAFAKVGIREWHYVRIGAEAVVLVPVDGRSDFGVGAAVTVELER